MAIVISPLYPVSGQEVTLTVSPATDNEQFWVITSVPTGSTTSTGLIERELDADEVELPGLEDMIQRLQSGARIENADDDPPNSFTPDKAGQFKIEAYSMVRTQGVPRYPGDPGGEIVQELVQTETGTIYVGETMDLPLVTEDGRGADLRIQINNDTVRAASFVNPRDEVSTVAAKQAAVVAALATLVGDTIAAMGANFVTELNDLRTQFVGHMAEVDAPPPDVHLPAADTVNTVDVAAVTEWQGGLALLNEIRTKLSAHLTDSSEAGAPWHQSTTADDLENLPLAAAATDLPSATVLLSELRWRVYNTHRAVTTLNGNSIHNAIDTANTLSTAATDLDDVIKEFFDALEELTPTEADDENQGEVDARATYGFTRTT